MYCSETIKTMTDSSTDEEQYIDPDTNRPLSQKETTLAKRLYKEYKEDHTTEISFSNYLTDVYFQDTDTDGGKVQHILPLADSSSSSGEDGFYVLSTSKQTSIEGWMYRQGRYESLMKEHVQWTIDLLLGLVGESQARQKEAITNLITNKKIWVAIMVEKGVSSALADQWYRQGSENDGLGTGIFLEHSLAAKTVFEHARISATNELILDPVGEDAAELLYGANTDSVIVFWRKAANLEIGESWKSHLDCTVKYATQLLIAQGNQDNEQFVDATEKCIEQAGTVGSMIDVAMSDVQVGTSIGSNQAIINSGMFASTDILVGDRNKSILEVLAANEETKDLATIIRSMPKDAMIYDVLRAHKDDPVVIRGKLVKGVTFFAPTSAALRRSGIRKRLMENQVARLLLFHVVPQSVALNIENPRNFPDARNLPPAPLHLLPSANDRTLADLTVTGREGEWLVNDANVVQANVPAKNGFIHLIDKVLEIPAKVSANSMLDNDVPVIESGPRHGKHIHANVPVIESKRNARALMDVPVIESKRYEPKGISFSSKGSDSPKILESKRGQNRSPFLTENRSRVLESKRGQREIQRVEKRVSATEDLCRKGKGLGLSFLDQIAMDEGFSVSSHHNHNHNHNHDHDHKKEKKKEKKKKKNKNKTHTNKEIGIREQSTIVYTSKRIASYVADPDELSETFSDKDRLKKFMQELNEVVDSLESGMDLAECETAYSMIDYRKLSEMSQDDRVRFVISVDSLSRLLEEHGYEGPIATSFIEANFLDVFRGLPGAIHSYITSFTKRTKDWPRLYTLIEEDTVNMTNEMIDQIVKERKDALVRITELARMGRIILQDLKTASIALGSTATLQFEVMMDRFKDLFPSAASNSIQSSVDLGFPERFTSRGRVKRGLLAHTKEMAKEIIEADRAFKNAANARKISSRVMELFGYNEVASDTKPRIGPKNEQGIVAFGQMCASMLFTLYSTEKFPSSAVRESVWPIIRPLLSL